jgi:CheY-like chemotaxis protein
VSTGAQAIAALERDRYDLVLLDVQLPDIDGLQVARRIRQAGDQFGQPYLVALTADTQPSTRAACVSAGMDTYLAKPLQLHDLHTVLAGYHHMVATPPAEARAGASPAPSLGAPAAPALDPETLERLRSLFGPHRERMHALIERFCADTAALPAKLFQAAAANDIEALRLGAHQLKSSSAIVAALPLAALGERLEQLIGTAGLAECPALIARIEQEIVRVQAALKAEFAD